MSAPAIGTSIRISPEYPADALESCVEGYVTLSFTIVNSKATNVRVIDSKPEGVFEKATLKNLQRMQFNKPDGFEYKEMRFDYKLDDGCIEKQPNKSLQQATGSLSRRLHRQAARKALATAEPRR